MSKKTVNLDNFRKMAANGSNGRYAVSVDGNSIAVEGYFVNNSDIKQIIDLIEACDGDVEFFKKAIVAQALKEAYVSFKAAATHLEVIEECGVLLPAWLLQDIEYAKSAIDKIFTSLGYYKDKNV